ncbi:hypothetical protein K438DRAFT_1830960 [Mycena galopus ATCC 62051]|nr:hypothetical protein K438DRAFT_1830960 [Mycena galopus ATCC 62051]
MTMPPYVWNRSVPFVDIAREVNELHKEGLIREFGLSNLFFLGDVRVPLHRREERVDSSDRLPGGGY